MLNISSNIIYLFNELDLLDRIDASARAGFRAVECQSPYDVPAAAFCRRAADAGLEVALINSLRGDADAGDKGLAIFADRIDEFRALTAESIDYAAGCGCPRLHLMTGTLAAGQTAAEADGVFLDNLAWAATRGREAGVRILLEPLHAIDNPGYYLTSAEKARNLMAALDHPNVYLQYDLYHGGMNGEDLEAAVTRHFDVIDHIQVAGVPGRHEPDTGGVDFGPAFALLEAKGYAGWIGAEYAPAGATLEGLGWAAVYGIGGAG